ncbi:MAG: AbrB/MazE/SpoVT family DNA-binding domain-containing protein [Acidimicrobiia bacterium]
MGPKGQVVIPKAMRERLGIRPGGEVEFVEVEGGVRVEPARHARELRGRYGGSRLTELLEAERRAELADEEDRAGRA